MRTRDPVCEMSVDDRRAMSSVHLRKTYHFWSASGKAAFEKDPPRYAKA